MVAGLVTRIWAVNSHNTSSIKIPVANRLSNSLQVDHQLHEWAKLSITKMTAKKKNGEMKIYKMIVILLLGFFLESPNPLFFKRLSREDRTLTLCLV